MIFGTHPLDGENTRILYGRLMDDIKAHIAEELELIRSGRLTHPDGGFMGYVFALNQLATDDPAIQHLAIYRDQVQEWEDEYLAWLGTVESKIPAKHRAGYREEVVAQLARLKAMGSAMPKDMW
jgi:hypothetical protein